MVSEIVLYNLGVYAAVSIILLLALPYPMRLGALLLSGFFESNLVSRRLAAISVLVAVTGLLVPAVLGIAPLSTARTSLIVLLSGLAYPGLFGGSVIGLAAWIGWFRLRRVVRAGSRLDLTSSPTEGPAVVTAEARRTHRAADGGSESTVDWGLLADYRRSKLAMDDVAEETVGETDRLRHAEQFDLEGPVGSVRVDPSGAFLGLNGVRAEERRIDEGDEVTAVGTIRLDDHGRLALSGDDDLLYITNDTPAEIRWQIRRTVYGGGVVVLLFLGLAVWILQALAG